MSKKIIHFTLLPSRAGEPDAAVRDITAEDSDSWVFAAERDVRHEPAMPIDDRFLIDLSANRSWFELMQLIWAFPFLATWFWMAGITGALPARHR
jgi:hypothetical protein